MEGLNSTPRHASPSPPSQPIHSSPSQICISFTNCTFRSSDAKKLLHLSTTDTYLSIDHEESWQPAWGVRTGIHLSLIIPHTTLNSHPFASDSWFTGFLSASWKGCARSWWNGFPHIRSQTSGCSVCPIPNFLPVDRQLPSNSLDPGTGFALAAKSRISSVCPTLPEEVQTLKLSHQTHWKRHQRRMLHR